MHACVRAGGHACALVQLCACMHACIVYVCQNIRRRLSDIQSTWHKTGTHPIASHHFLPQFTVPHTTSAPYSTILHGAMCLCAGDSLTQTNVRVPRAQYLNELKCVRECVRACVRACMPMHLCRRATFCFAPPGWTLWSFRMY